MKKLLNKEAIIGLCVIIALAILYFGIEYLKGISVFKPSNYYYAVFTDVKGLTTSAPVNVNGVKIGQVDNVEIMYDQPGKVLVQFSIEKKFHLPKGSAVMLESSLLGEANLRLNLAQNNSYYSSGDTLRSLIQEGLMEEVSSNLLPGVNKTLPKVDSLLVNLNDLTGNPAIARSLANIESLTASLKVTAAALNTSSRKLPELMSELQAVANNANAISTDLASLSKTLADAPVDSTLKNINRLSAELASLSSSLNNPDSNLGKLLNDTELYDNLIQATADIDSLLVDIKKNPKRYISIKLL